ncbi:GNAT family N-acetyltransferase [Vibrio astriarenae]|uniref:GNAT family N-acetyltransferase n=1 Tax=Vibrio astriarenae TaxID=1481923 RepID=UPI00260BB460|nr:GNAT family N-acetyltransferase [uncultured Vibrio sp.]
MKLLKSEYSTKNVVKDLMQAYLHDMSPYTGERPDEKGLYSLGKYFDLYWTDKDRFAYLCLHEDEPIGLALVREITPNQFSISEFFILSSKRRKGIATHFAQEVFQQHRGRWSVSQLESNKVAQCFWRRTISSYTEGAFSEGWSSSQPLGPKQSFDNSDL